MIDPGMKKLPIIRQCELVSISRSVFYYTGKGESPLNLLLMRLIDEQFDGSLRSHVCFAIWRRLIMAPARWRVTFGAVATVSPASGCGG